jgi:hypothetical protein
VRFVSAMLADAMVSAVFGPREHRRRALRTNHCRELCSLIRMIDVILFCFLALKRTDRAMNSTFNSPILI